MDDTGGRAWSWLVQAAAFTAVAGLMALLMSFGLDGPRMYPAVLVVVMVLAIPFGLIPYALARRSGRVGWREAAMAGLLAGALFGLILFLLLLGGTHSSSQGGVALWQNGVSTVAGMAESAAIGALCTVIGGLAGLLLKYLVPPDLLFSTRTPMRPHWRDALPLALAIGAVAAVPISEQATRDRSCFNLFRSDDAPRSVTPNLSLRLHVNKSQWPDVARSFAAFAKAKGWQSRGKTEIREDWNWFQYEACREPGVKILLLQVPPDDAGGLIVSVTAARPDIAWEADLQRLIGMLARHGPITRDRQTETRRLPSWAQAIPVEPEAPPTPPSMAAPAAR